MWYWHSPFEVSDKERSLLKAVNVTTLYVRAATFTTDGVRAKTEFPVQWKDAPADLSVVVVFNFDAGLRGHFSSLPNGRLAEEVVQGILASCQRAEAKRVRLAGVQMDVDCPTRYLDKYGEFLEKVRLGLEKVGLVSSNQSFSTTALSTWLSKSAYRRVANACDFVAPQFYEGETGPSLSSIKPIADPAEINRGVQNCDSLGKPYFAGLAIYGHAILYDRRNMLLGVYHGLKPVDALRSRSLVLESDKPNPTLGPNEGELCFYAAHPDPYGHGQGFRLAYLMPTPAMLGEQIHALQDARPQNCRGIILYRFPEEDDEQSLPLPTVAAALANQPLKVAAYVTVRREAEPWAVIDSASAAKRPPYRYVVSANSTGNSPTRVGPDGFIVSVRFDKPGIEDFKAGGFDTATAGSTLGGDFEPCAPAHADTLILRKFALQPGEKLGPAVIEIASDGPRPVAIRWTVQAPQGAQSTEREQAPTFDESKPNLAREKSKLAR